MKPNEFDAAKSVARLIGNMFSPHLEVVFHDLSQQHFPIIEIINRHITGRQVGDQTSLFKSLDLETDQVINYTFEHNGTSYKSSSIVLKSNCGSPILGISFNFNTQPIQQFQLFLSSFFNDNSFATLSSDPNKIDLRNEVHKTLMELNLSLYSLNSDDIKSVLAALSQKGLLDTHGMISFLAKEFKITRATLYRYKEDLNID